jgi:predicted dehydrogenase
MMLRTMTTRISRRGVLQAAAAAAAAIVLATPVRGNDGTVRPVRVGVIGADAPRMSERLARRHDVVLSDPRDAQAVVIATPLERRAAAAIQAMGAGKFVGVVAPVASTIDECLQLVRVQRETHAGFIPLARELFDRPAVLVQAMVDGGLFGELAYAAAAHDAIAPACRWMGGERLVAMVATAADGTLIRTAKGRLIELRADGSAALHGTRGAYESSNGRRMVHLDGRTTGGRWEDLDKYGSPAAPDADDAMIDAFVNAVRSGVSPIGVVDAVTWSAIRPLRAASLAGGGKPLDIPNFADA